MAGKSAFSYLVSENSTTRLVALRVLIGLSKAGVFSECPGNSRFELQISNIPHG